LETKAARIILEYSFRFSQAILNRKQIAPLISKPIVTGPGELIPISLNPSTLWLEVLDIAEGNMLKFRLAKSAFTMLRGEKRLLYGFGSIHRCLEFKISQPCVIIGLELSR
jgi:hypothetical protein